MIRRQLFLLVCNKKNNTTTDFFLAKKKENTKMFLTAATFRLKMVNSGTFSVLLEGVEAQELEPC